VSAPRTYVFASCCLQQTFWPSCSSAVHSLAGVWECVFAVVVASLSFSTPTPRNPTH
jgi:hypothetical protein